MSFRADAPLRPSGIARRGFTLIELLVVITIIATLAALVGPAIFRNAGDAKVSAAKGQIDMFAVALNSYRLDNDNFPETVQGLDALRQRRRNCFARSRLASSEPLADSAIRRATSGSSPRRTRIRTDS